MTTLKLQVIQAFLLVAVAITIACNTVSSNTVPSNTVPSNTVPSNTVPSNTVPSNTVPGPTVTSNETPDGTPSQQQGNLITLSVIGSNDLHGHLRQLPLFGGYVANLRARREADGGGVVLLDAGDMFQGTLESNLREGASVIEAFNQLGYHAAAVGNHEFDFGPSGPHATPVESGEDPLGAIRARARQAEFPLLASNLLHSDGATLQGENIKTSTAFDLAGVRIGVVGGTSMSSLLLTHPANVRELRTSPLAEAIRREAKRLRADGADVVIALVHAGGRCTELREPTDLTSCSDDSEIFRLARSLSPGEVDLIVGGHIHQGVAHFVNDIPMIVSFSQGRAFGRVDLVIDKSLRRVVATKIQPPQELCRDDLAGPSCASDSYEGSVPERDAPIESIVNSALARTREIRAEPLGVTTTTSVAHRVRDESPLGNLFVDWMLRVHPKADAAFNNSGGLRQSLPAGELNYGDLYEVFPFDNYFATLRLNGAQLARVIQRSLLRRGGFLALGGLRARLRCVAAGRAQVTLFRQDGTPVADDEELLVVTSDFLASGGDNALSGIELAAEDIVIEGGKTMRDLIADVLRASGETLDGNAVEITRRRIEFPGERPVRCL